MIIRRADLTPSRPQRICMRPMPMLVLPFPAINPVLVQWGPLAIRWYALAYIAGLVLGWRLIRHIVSRRPLLEWGQAARAPIASTTCSSIAPSGVIIGGRLGNVLFYDPQYYFSHPIDIFKIWEGGMAFHGGLIGALVGVLLFCPPLWRARTDRARPMFARRADWHLPRPYRQFHPPRTLGSPD